jgi:DNA-binding GntR family transcriptional regulator
MTQDTVYDRLRAEILSGALPAGERLIAAEIAQRFASSTNPVREALHQLRGEGLVEILPNRGARVRELGAAFVRDVMEVEQLLEPFLTRSFVRVATEADIAELLRIQSEIERNDFEDLELHHHLDTQFHRAMYDSHRNRLAVDVWFRHRVMLGTVANGFRISPGRRIEVIRDHRALIEAVIAGDEDKAAEIVFGHVRGSGEHVIEHLQKVERRRESLSAQA